MYLLEIMTNILKLKPLDYNISEIMMQPNGKIHKFIGDILVIRASIVNRSD